MVWGKLLRRQRAAMTLKMRRHIYLRVIDRTLECSSEGSPQRIITLEQLPPHPHLLQLHISLNKSCPGLHFACCSSYVNQKFLVSNSAFIAQKCAFLVSTLWRSFPESWNGQLHRLKQVIIIKRDCGSMSGALHGLWEVLILRVYSTLGRR